jgi:CheY-like chemotaxis protein
MKKVLAADDFASIRALVRAVLEESGYSMLEAIGKRPSVTPASFCPISSFMAKPVAVHTLRGEIELLLPF